MVFVFMISFQNLFADTTLIKDEKCKEMVKNYVDDPFQLDLKYNNAYQLESTNYFDLVKSTVLESMTALCSSKKNLVGLSEFKDKLQTSCINTCEKYKNLYSTKEKAQAYAGAACKNVCQGSYKKIQLIEKGVAMAASRETIDASSCGNQVASASRASGKAVEAEGSVQTGAKKTTGK